MSSGGVEVDLCLYRGRPECSPEIKVAVLGDEHDLWLTAGVGFSDEPQSRWVGGVSFTRVGEIRSIVIHEALFNLILRYEMYRRQLLVNLG